MTGFSLTTPLCGRDHYPHFRDEETEAQRVNGLISRSAEHMQFPSKPMGIAGIVCHLTGTSENQATGDPLKATQQVSDGAGNRPPSSWLP